MGAGATPPHAARGAVTRRVLLAAGGLAVLGACASDLIQWDEAGARARDAQGAPAAAAASGRRPARELGAVSRPGARGPGEESASAAPARRRLAAAGHRDDVAGDVPMVRIDDGPTTIALTIDDGPHPVYTPQVLRLLEKYRVTATFSMIGIEVRAYPGLARDVAAAGHLIANHTWAHLNLAGLPPALVTGQMDQATEAIHAATGRTPGLFRAPYGAWSPVVLQQCARTGMTPLAWSVDPRDWSRPGVNSIVANIMRNTRTGSIILEHDGGGNRSQTVAALKIVIPRLLAEGYRFGTP